MTSGQYAVKHGDEQVASLNIDDGAPSLGQMATIEITMPPGGRSQPITVTQSPN